MDMRQFLLTFGLLPKEELTEEDIEKMSFEEALRYYPVPEKMKD